MSGEIGQVAIVGGGTAGWLSACVLAARHPWLQVTLVEAPDIPTIGVGEGTWPTMRETLATIGIPEFEFLTACDASFKQGSRFDGWVSGDPGDSYCHPFTLPPAGDMRELLAACDGDASFAAAMTPQLAVSAANLAPRQRAMPDYAGALNYAYHLDAGKFAALLARHAVQRLGVRRLSAKVVAVRTDDSCDIVALELDDGTSLAADLFVDCSGQAGLLIDGHFGVEWVDRSDVSFNDRALAVQVPTAPDSELASVTIGTAHEAGWLWDIALPTRRGIGCVYSSRHLSDSKADEVLRDYVARSIPDCDAASLNPRLLAFRTGHRTHFWHRNCIAIGLSAGFIEPLEASAIVMIELSLRALGDALPMSRAAMDIHAERFNARFRYRWDRIVEFLKLHYVLSRRDEPYWLAQRAPETVPQRLAENLRLWAEQPPSAADFPDFEEVFPAASQQYVLYGMTNVPQRAASPASGLASARLAEVRERTRSMLAGLPSNRAYFDAIATVPAERRTA
ncbi:MAG: tryptophan halogenase family protein [Novosphingobium sp.]